MADLSLLLQADSNGDGQAAAALLPLVYAELRQLAAQKLNQEVPGQTLQPTALVHEAYLRLVGTNVEASWNGRGHFFAAAGLAMRRILIESARRKHSSKRGGAMVRHTVAEDLLADAEPAEELLALDEALTTLKSVNSLAADIVQLRYFAGLTLDETADALGISARSAGRKWSYARAWLREAIQLHQE